MPDEKFLHTTHRSVSWFKDQYERDAIDLRPPFQRKPVWTENQKSYLIDTILHGYPIPELYMQESVDSDGNETHIVVDGQQRTRACIEFIQGRFAINGKDSPNWADMKFDDFGGDLRKKLFGYKFVIRLLPSDLSDTEIRAIFQRLNRNTVALNAQELRHATYWGEFIQFVEKLADDDFWAEAGVFTANDFRRMLDIEFISELTIAVMHGPQNKKDKLDYWYQTYEPEMPRKRHMTKVFRNVTGELSHQLETLLATRWRKKSDFYTLFLLLAEYVETLPLAKEQRTELGNQLQGFGDAVDACVSADPPARAAKRALNYAHAVQKAASDVANRLKRYECLKAQLSSVFD